MRKKNKVEFYYVYIRAISFKCNRGMSALTDTENRKFDVKHSFIKEWRIPDESISDSKNQKNQIDY